MSSSLTGNPVVVAEESNMEVALNQEVTLRVYVAGDPLPGADDIQWYKNGNLIVTSSSFTFTSDRQSLMIVLMDRDAAGIYECRVTTIEGMSSAFINVTFPGIERACVYMDSIALLALPNPISCSTFLMYVFVYCAQLVQKYNGIHVLSFQLSLFYTVNDCFLLPLSLSLSLFFLFLLRPEIVVLPSMDEVLIGSFSSFMCIVTSTLEYTLTWNFDGSSQLPEGVKVDDAVLTIPSAQPFHSGTYTCQADAQVHLGSFSAILHVVVKCEFSFVIRTLSLVCVCVLCKVLLPS